MEYEKIINEVLNIFKNDLKAVEYAKNHYVLQTPFFFNTGNPVMVAVVIISENDFILTDMKSTLSNLYGDDEKSNQFALVKANKILDKYGLNNNDGEICIRCNKAEMLGSFNRFMHAVILIDNMIA